MTKHRPLPKGAVTIPKTAKKVFTGEIFDTYQWRQKLYDGTQATFEMLKRPDTVVILAIVDGKVVLEEQTQPSKPWHFTLPAGRVDPGETPLAAAKREMREETGMTFSRWELKSAHQLHTKFDWYIYTFVAQDLLQQEPQQLDGGEKIKVTEVAYSKIVSLVKTGHMQWSQFLLGLILNNKESLKDVLAHPNFKEAA